MHNIYSSKEDNAIKPMSQTTFGVWRNRHLDYNTIGILEVAFARIGRLTRLRTLYIHVWACKFHFVSYLEPGGSWIKV